MAGCRVLLVDDEAALLRLMQTYLSRLGYEVTAAEDWDRAIEEFGSGAHMEVAIVDLSLLAGMDDLVSAARENPRTRFLICSGRPFELHSLPEDLHDRFGFLQKPFLPKMLASTIEGMRQA